MEERKDEDEQKPEEQKEVWTTENDSNGNEMNLSSELTRNLFERAHFVLAQLHQHLFFY